MAATPDHTPDPTLHPSGAVGWALITLSRDLWAGRGVGKPLCSPPQKQPPPGRCRAARSQGVGCFAPLMVMHGPANSPHTAVNPGAAAAPTL